MSIGFFLLTVFMYMFYLIEPYNAHDPKPKKKKKHWMEIAEEEALMHKIALEEQSRQKFLYEQALKQHLALREASALQNQQNLALLSQIAPPSSQQFQDGATVAGNAGAGGTPVLSFFGESSEAASFSYTLNAVAGPVSTSFNNTTPSPENDTFLWQLTSSYGIVTSTAINFPTTVLNTGSYTMILQSTSSQNHGSLTSTNIVIPAPSLTVEFSLSNTTASAPFTESFTNLTSVNSNGPISYRWVFGDGTTSTLVNPTHVYNTGSFTARLEATTSYNITSSTSHTLSGSFPVVTAAWTETNPTGLAPLTTSFVNTSTINNGVAPTTYLWTFGDGTTSTATNPTHSYETGSFTVILRATGSYNAASMTTHTNVISASMPSIIPHFTSDVVTGPAPLRVTFTDTSTYNTSSTTPGLFTYKWLFGSGSATSASQGPVTMTYNSSSIYSVTLQITGSKYNIRVATSSLNYISASV